MAGYVVTGRIDGVVPRMARRSRPLASPDHREPALAGDRELIDLVGRPEGVVIAERWARCREIWAQTTFFLFDPESWR